MKKMTILLTMINFLSSQAQACPKLEGSYMNCTSENYSETIEVNANWIKIFQEEKDGVKTYFTNAMSHSGDYDKVFLSEMKVANGVARTIESFDTGLIFEEKTTCSNNSVVSEITEDSELVLKTTISLNKDGELEVESFDEEGKIYKVICTK